MMRRETAWPSSRELAVAAGVAPTTLRHYFGDRREIVSAVFDAYHQNGAGRLAAIGMPAEPLARSISDYARMLIQRMTAPAEVRLGDVIAVSLGEGLLDPSLASASLCSIVDPSIDALRRRLDQHVARGEMIATDTRAAALILFSPILVAVLHQDQMGGRADNPIDLDVLADAVCAAFLKAYAAPNPALAAVG